jgi:hypothetical protein
MEAVAAAGFKTVGTYMLAQIKIGEQNVYSGDTTSGSNLTTEANGTWRNMGRNAYAPSPNSGSEGGYTEATTALFLRIS